MSSSWNTNCFTSQNRYRRARRRREIVVRPLHPFRADPGRGAFKDVYRSFDRLTGVDIAWNQICLGDHDDKTLKIPQKIRSFVCRDRPVELPLPRKRHEVLFLLGRLPEHDGEPDNRAFLLREPKEKAFATSTQTPCIVHRDLKCDNIFIDITRHQWQGEDRRFQTGHQNEVCSGHCPRRNAGIHGPEYYAEEYNELVDVYAFGLCLMEMMTLEYPYCEHEPGQDFQEGLEWREVDWSGESEGFK
ncbi:Probable serine/threonine-protein kinase WNK3 [Striga hermonthica]|uniref:non-specific serine/threonine protein kinase n=1 Tax=Striga hermonthica TaxID=68872 RepID=A0A9N7RNX9_STRHE|nr:Probable serine/threonine-protein kinase WNK3 [Striga hermonthica]